MESNTDKRRRMPRYAVVTLKVIASLLGIFAGLILVIHFALSPAVLTSLINKYGNKYIDGNLNFGKAGLSMFSHFPNASLTLEDFSITYPADRFKAVSSEGVSGELMFHGCGEKADTLASFREFSASLNLFTLITGKINIPYINLEKPRIFAHRYSDSRCNWDIFITESGQQEQEQEEGQEQEAESSLPEIRIGQVILVGRPHIVYTDCIDTLFATINLKQLQLKGRLTTGRVSSNRISLDMDSLFVAGRLSADTIAFGMDSFKVMEHRGHMDVKASAKALYATSTFGRTFIPLELSTSVVLPKDTVPAVNLSRLKAEIAGIPLEGDASLLFKTGCIGVDANLMIDNCKLDALLKDVVSHFVPQAQKISTDACIDLRALCHGDYIPSTGHLPTFDIQLDVPQAQVRHSDIKYPLNVRLSARAANDSSNIIKASIENCRIDTKGLALKMNASVGDLLGEDPLIGVDAALDAELDTLERIFIPDSLGIEAKGNIRGTINGKALLSQLDLYNFAEADLKGNIECNCLKFNSPRDTIFLDLDNVNIGLSPIERKSRKDPGKTFRMLALTGGIDSLFVNYKDGFLVEGKKISIEVKNAVNTETLEDTTRINPLGIRINADKLLVTDADGANVTLDKTSNSLFLRPKKGHKEIPVMTVSSDNKRIYLKSDYNRAILTDASFKATAGMNTIERKQKVNHYLDSLSKVYPGVPRDSLFIYAKANRIKKPIPDWLKDDDFRKKDPNLHLDQAMAKYFREWDLEGDLSVRTGILMTPYLPLKNFLRGCGIHFTNNTISIDTLAVMSGKSHLAAKGALTGIRRALLGRGIIKLDLDLYSNGMDANQLLKAYAVGAKFSPEQASGLEGASNSEFLQMVTTDVEEEEDAPTPLFVIPANINANIDIDARDINYIDLDIQKAVSKIVMKERCVQITNTTATSNMGDISFDGFYATRNKDDIKAGFNFNFKDITAEKVISLMPAVDSLMPMLKSFSGLLNCEMAATADLDTNMNVIMPSINGVMRISGDNLTIRDNEMFRTLARKLLFKNKKVGFIDNMKVEGVIKDNTIEVFPFVLNIDRYKLAMSGIQNLDMSFKYHISVIRSPFLFKIGINLFGPDFDHMKFKIGKAKYKNTNIPAFSSVIDDTRINLMESIKGIFEKGVEAAVNESNRQEALEEEKRKTGYVNAAQEELEPLSEQEQKQIEEAEAQEAALEAEQERAEKEAAGQDDGEGQEREGKMEETKVEENK